MRESSLRNLSCFEDPFLAASLLFITDSRHALEKTFYPILLAKENRRNRS